MIVACPTYRKYDLCVEMILSGDAGTLKPDKYVILDNSAGGFIPHVQEHKPELLEREDITILDVGYNAGVAKGWNILLDYVKDNLNDAFTVVVNDDIVFLDNTLELLYDAYVFFKRAVDYEETSAIVYCGGGIDAINAFSMFGCVPSVLFDKVGRFSEVFYPSYHEDSDMYHRMRLKGYDLYRVPDCNAYHSEGGSATIKSYTPQERALHDHQFRRGRELYIRMWGGIPGEEKYNQMFNGEDIMHHMQEIYKRYGF